MPRRNQTQNTQTAIDTHIASLELARSSKVIIYCTSDKMPQDQFGTRIASDVIPLFREILEQGATDCNKISLVLDTSGGHLETPWPLVNLVREYCKTFEVIVLEKALSAGTLLSLGADKIVMMPYSQLSPIDPAANIIDGANKQVKRLEIEDIIGYIDFAKNKIGIAEQSALTEIMKELTKEISPTVLGSVNRTHALIRRLAKNLLDLHNNKLSEKDILEITENLTQKLYSHSHFINRREAKNIVGLGKIIEFAKDNTKTTSDAILNYLRELMEINEDFNPQTLVESESEAEKQLTRAVVYSKDLKFNFVSKYKIVKLPDPSGQQQVMVNNISNKWEKNN